MTDDDRTPPTPRAGSGGLSRRLDALRDRLGVDPRALAATRVGLGVALLLDLLLRARYLTTFYADAGVLPRAELARLSPAYRAISIHALSGEAWVQALAFAVAGAFALALLAGYRTRLATAASLVLLVSLQARNPLVLNAGDVLLRRLLFWGLFLPLGGRWSVDAVRAGPRRERVTGLAAVALLLQVTLVYASNAAFKLSGDAWLSGEAVRYVFALDTFTVGFAPLLAGRSALLAVLTWGWLALILASPLLVVFGGRARTALAALFAAGHVGMALTMDLGVFPLVSLVGLLPFLGPGVWNRADGRGLDVLPAVDRRLPRGPLPSDPVPDAAPLRRVRTLALAGLVAGLLLWNAVAVGVVNPGGVPDAVEERSWNMFGHPPGAEQWVVANATTRSGDAVVAPVSTDGAGRPAGDGRLYPAARWRKYQNDLVARDDPALYAALASDVCRRWSDEPNGPLRSVELRLVTERTRLVELRRGTGSTRPGGADERTAATVGRYGCSAAGSSG